MHALVQPCPGHEGLPDQVAANATCAGGAAAARRTTRGSRGLTAALQLQTACACVQEAADAAHRWRCGGQTDDSRFKKFDCNWVGNWIRPGGLAPRRERDITLMNKDEWVDSVELREARSLPHISLLCHLTAPHVCTRNRIWITASLLEERNRNLQHAAEVHVPVHISSSHTQGIPQC